ncbi:macrolide ABC transporter ATP-binding protein [bacterium]|nr:macrolide ABC transporter ATP-binding protein [bacterium]
MSIITLANISKTYSEKTAYKTIALDDISLAVTEGEFLAISGPSGSGKTTLLNLIGGLDSPSKGRIILNNNDITGLKENELSQIRLHHIGFIFQAYNLIPVLTAMENMEYILMLQRVKKQERQQRVKDVASRLKIDELLHKKPSEMSGGQQQRVAIARAIVSKPKLILADEPTANLDSKTSDILLELMKELNEEHKMTFIFATHDSSVIQKAKRHISLLDGMVLDDTTK